MYDRLMMQSILQPLFWIVVALVVEETARRRFPDWLPWAWLFVVALFFWWVASSPWGMPIMAKFSEAIGGTALHSYLVVSLIGAATFSAAWYVINRSLDSPGEATVKVRDQPQVAGRFHQSGEFSLADNNVIIGSDGSVPDIAQTGKGSIMADNLTIVDRQHVGKLFNLVILEIVEIEDMDKSKMEQLINVLEESSDRWRKTGGADIFEDDAELVEKYMPRTRNGETLKKILTSGMGLPTREVWQRRHEEN